MYEAVQLVTVLVVAVAMALSLAHALELPGKKRLDRETSYAVQPIYYPGFTIGGAIGEVGGLVMTLLLLFLVPFASAEFWLVLAALLGLIGMQAVYWLFTHPVNREPRHRRRLEPALGEPVRDAAHRDPVLRRQAVERRERRDVVRLGVKPADRSLPTIWNSARRGAGDEGY